MPTRVMHERLGRVARGLTSGALALSVLGWGGGVAGAPAVVRPALAEEIDCYNDKDLYDLPECVERREIDRQTGNSPNEAQGASGPTQPASEEGAPAAGGPAEQGGGQPPPQPAAGPPQQPSGSPPQQPAAASQPSGGSEEGDAEQPRSPVADPWKVVLTLEDAGKEATQYISEEGTDKYGRWARTRFERDRTTAASTLGPNVLDSKVWIAKDVNAAKELFKEQAAIKNFPERKEGISGPNERAKPTKYGEQFSVVSSYWQDDKVWQHYRFVIQQGNVVAVLYMFGREDFFLDPKDKGWTGQGDWYTAAIFHRM